MNFRLILKKNHNFLRVMHLQNIRFEKRCLTRLIDAKNELLTELRFVPRGKEEGARMRRGTDVERVKGSGGVALDTLL